MLEKRIAADLKESIKQKDNLKKETLRLIRAALQNAAIAKKKKELSEEEVLQVLKKLKKQHKESIEAFKKGNRPDLTKKEEEELAVLSKYLPEDLLPEEILKLVVKAIEKSGAQSRKEMGKVMKILLAEAKGQIDGKEASFLVLKELEKKETK